MAIFGIVMLLPGLCALLFGGISISDRGQIDSDVSPLVFLGLGGGAWGRRSDLGRHQGPARLSKGFA